MPSSGYSSYILVLLILFWKSLFTTKGYTKMIKNNSNNDDTDVVFKWELTHVTSYSLLCYHLRMANSKPQALYTLFLIPYNSSKVGTAKLESHTEEAKA